MQKETEKKKKKKAALIAPALVTALVVFDLSSLKNLMPHFASFIT